MPLPFPGMNPYLENPDLWPEVHHLLISLLAETLNPQLLPTYRVAIEKRVYQLSGEDALLIGIPDVAIAAANTRSLSSSFASISLPPHLPIPPSMPMPIEVQEGYLEVREVATQTVVTVIEVLSPANKRPGRGREAYLQKRDVVLGSHTHLVEIDLLRSGAAMPMAGAGVASAYRIVVSRQERRPHAELYPFGLTDAIPPFAVPLKPGSEEPVVQLDALLQTVIDRAGLSVVLDYQSDPTPALTPDAQTWLEEVLKQSGYR